MIKKILFALILVAGLTACSDNSIKIDENSTLADLKGQPVAVLIGGTYCPHCQKSAPIFETQIWEPYHEQTHIFINVIDGQNTADGQTGKRFELSDVPQVYGQNFMYEKLTNEKCGYVPSWVLLDSEGKVALSSCGNDKSLDDMEAKLKELIGA